MAKKLKTSTKGYKKSSPDKNEPALRIPSGRITMKDVPFPVLGIDNYGNSVIMQPGEEYQFPGSEVIEMPVLQTGGRAPIYTSNPNDPRLRAYNDSLAAYNSYVSDDEFFSQKAIFKNLNQQRYYPEAVFNNAAIGVSKSKINPIGYNNYNYSSNIEWEGLPKSRLSIPVYKKPVQPVVYQEPQQAPVKRKQQVPVKKKQPTYEDSLYAYKKGLSVIKEHIKDAQSSGVPASLKVKPLGDAKEYAYENYTVNGVRPIGRYTTISDDYLLPAYKKPVGTPQPQEPKIDAPKKRQTSYARDLSIVPIEAAKPTVSQSLYDSSKPTNWSFTYPTGQYNEQKTMYFPDRDSWKKFVDQQKLSNSQETSEQGTATGYMKKGGLTPNKAREILHDGKVHGKKLTEKQRRFFGAMSKGHTNFRGRYSKNSPFVGNPYLDIHTPSGLIDMSNTEMDLIGIDNKGNKKKMKAFSKNPYKFEGDVVREIPANPYMQDGGKTLIPEWFNSPYKGDLKNFAPKVDVQKKEGQSKKIEQQKKVEKILSKQKTIGPTKQFISHDLEKKHEEERLKKLEEYAATHPEVEVSPYGNLTTSSYGEFIQKYGKNLDKFAGSMETPLAIQGAGDLLYGVGKLGAKYLPQVGEYLTTQTPLKNTYKYNPWAFKPNPEAYYRRIGGDEGLDDLLTSGEVRASQIHHTKNLQGINLAKAHTEPYFSIGVPFDTRYGPKNQFYKGPYILELKNHPMTGKVNGKLSRKANIGVPLEPVYLDNPNLKIYKEDWLKGYKEVPKPKSTFKSEIDWSKWNPEQGTATGYMKKGGLTPNKAREILHDGKVHGKKLTEKQRRFFGAMSKGHTKKYQIGGNLGKAAASASTTDEQLVLKKNEDYLKNIGLVHYANASRKPISSNFEYIPDFDESLQFIKNWYGSPEALDRMTKLVGKRTLAEKNMESAKENVENTFVFSDPERVKNIIKQYESRMTYAPESEKKQLYDELIRLDVNRISALEAKRDFYGDMIDKNKGFSAGFFNANGSIVNINEGLVKTASDFGHPLQKQSRETLKRTSVHELSHASGMDKLMKKFEPKPLHKSVKNAIEMGFVVPRIKELSKELEGKQPDRDYLESDTFYPRIMELRFIHGIKPGDTIDKKKLEEIKKNPKSAKNPLFRYYGDDDIIWMMNNLVKANNNSNTENTMKKGGIHIDPKNKGKFTKSAKAAGMGVQEFARHVLANKEDYSPTQVKRANFARNAKKWSAQKGFVVPSGETWQFDPITGEPMGAPEKWRNEDDPVTIPGLKEHLAKIKAGVPTYPFKTTGNEGSVQNPMGAGAPDNGPEKKPSKNYLPTLNAINFGLTKFAESLRNKELERYNRQMIALQNVPQPRRLTRIEQYGDPSVYQIGGMIPEDVSYLMGTIPNFDMLPTPAKSSSGMDNVVQGAIKGTTQQAKGTPVPGSDYENVIYNTYIENGLTPQAALFLTAQTMHETADYSSNVFKQNNNVAGIKIPRKRKSPFIEGVGTAAPANESKDQKYNKYAKYKDVKSGAMDLLEWMKYNKIDPNKFNTPEEYAEALRQKSYFGNTEEGKKIYVAGLQNKIKKLKKKGFEKGGEYDLSDSEIAELKAQGYDIEIID